MSDADIFRKDARAWIEENLPLPLRGNPLTVAQAMVDGANVSDDVLLWWQRVRKAGACRPGPNDMVAEGCHRNNPKS